jgi:PTS system beta-glucosides-specific IIC component
MQQSGYLLLHANFFWATLRQGAKCNEIIAMVSAPSSATRRLTRSFKMWNSNHDLWHSVVKAAWTIGESTKVFSYTESVIPILLAVLVLRFVERFLKKHVPDIMQIVLVPGLSILIMLPLTLCFWDPWASSWAM